MSDKFDPAARTAHISSEIRKAIHAALPAPPEQFLSVMVPGKVINYEDYSQGFDTAGEQITPILPNVTELNQAILCDDMPVLSPVQLGPSGRSVARSYATAIGKLVPAGSTVGIEVPVTDQEKRYQKAMDWLTSEVAEKPGMSRVELYTQKQFAYTKVVEDKTRAFNDALKKCTEDRRNKTVPAQRAAFDDWVNENARTYRNYVQAAYMDWVITGKKEEVEYWFSVVDQDSALSRVEQSKEAMRAAVVQDTDGSIEYHKVKLTPPNWAVLAKNKATNSTHTTRTVEWYTWEISRLQKMNAMLEALKTPIGPSQAIALTAETTSSDDDVGLQQVMQDFIRDRDAYEKTELNLKASDEQKSIAYKKYQVAQEVMRNKMAENDKQNVRKLNKLSQAAQGDMFKALSGDSAIVSQILKENTDKIEQYETLRANLLTNVGGGTSGLALALAKSAGIPGPQPDPESVKANTSNKEMDFFTPIAVEVSSASSTDNASVTSFSGSFGASRDWGMFGAETTESSKSNTASEAASSLSKCSCKISFDCMRVDITRNWLRGELFYDHDLVPAPPNLISPGFGRLRVLMEGTTGQSAEDIEAELERYNAFPMYPTAFLLACNVVLEISGETSAIQSHFSTSSKSASSKINYGPFSVSDTFSHTETQAHSICEATTSGCRITIKSPQIIGWISQMLPALPRLGKAEQAAAIAAQETMHRQKTPSAPRIAAALPESTEIKASALPAPSASSKPLASKINGTA